MIKKIATLSAAMMLFAGTGSAFAYNAQLKPYSDVKKDWASESIYKLSVTGVVSGMGNGTFQGNGVLTREAFIKMLMAANPQQIESKTNTSMKLTDMQNATHWSYDYVKKAYDQGLIQFMIKDNQFKPKREITREEVAVLTGNLLLQKKTDAERKAWEDSGWKNEQSIRKLADASKINPSYLPELYYSSSLGIMVGDKTGAFRPHASLTRKEAASIIERVINERIKEQPLSGIGYYAIESFKQANQMSHLKDIKFGWSELSYTADGMATLDMKSGEYAVPNGWEAAIQIADQNKVHKELSIFAHNGKGQLSKFLMDAPAQQAFIQSVQSEFANNPYGFTGISVDFEGIKKESEQAAFVSFLRELKQSLNGLTLSVAVPPTNWYKGYDLKSIGAIADQVILMAYDYTHMESKLPSAPLPLVNETIQSALKVIPKKKLVLGISKQANQWITRTDGTVVSEQPSIKLVEERAAKPGSKVEFVTPYFLSKITFKDDRGSHEIWYEDAQSIEHKIWLAKFYDLQGVSLWHMGNYTAADYEIIKQHTTQP
ncbi:glycosyl hydrolase family 18 protein [Paenibacillus arenosi]|uniref:S-layer homology domain-containing protein n=1 Tax=Paenibacillus arenosi TaxID=2774142 RepID=A0ABR9AUD1_9BACL|nr:glycosyl hydrolase family 18 protein [Paenibacillus arenosi]MBD8497318.1 S-layer homology domain-containing protein [Paenibacillus arenosi]